MPPMMGPGKGIPRIMGGETGLKSMLKGPGPGSKLAIIVAMEGLSMVMDEEEFPKPKPEVRNLEPMSIDELEDYISGLKAEITRVEADIKAKQQHHATADAVFQK